LQTQIDKAATKREGREQETERAGERESYGSQYQNQKIDLQPAQILPLSPKTDKINRATEKSYLGLPQKKSL